MIVCNFFVNFEIISQQIWDWNIPRITPNTIQIHGEGGGGTTLALHLSRLRRRAHVTCVTSYFTTCAQLLLIKHLRALYLVVKYYWNEAHPGRAILWMSSAKYMKKLSLLLLANNLLLKMLLRRLDHWHLICTLSDLCVWDDDCESQKIT
jgi:hypothetical protein